MKWRDEATKVLISFERDGKIIFTEEGKEREGTWEIKDKDVLKLEIAGEQQIFTKRFLNDDLFWLKNKKEGGRELLLIKEEVAAHMSFIEYLKTLYYQAQGTALSKLADGRYLEIHTYRGWIAHNKVTIEGEPVPDSTLFIPKNRKKYKIRDSRIVKVIVRVAYHYKDGALAIEKEENKDPARGDAVFYNAKPAKDGLYRIQKKGFIKVKNGKIAWGIGMRFLRQ